jgi:hypothetical protein
LGITSNACLDLYKGYVISTYTPIKTNQCWIHCRVGFLTSCTMNVHVSLVKPTNPKLEYIVLLLGNQPYQNTQVRTLRRISVIIREV